MTALVRTSILAVLALVASLLGITPAQAVPDGASPLFAAGASGTPQDLRLLSQTAAGLVYASGSASTELYVRPTGGTAALDDRWTYATAVGDLISQYDYQGTVTWRTIADATFRTHTVPDGLTRLAGTGRGYVAQSGSGPYSLVAVDLIAGTQSTIGAAATDFENVHAGPAGVVARTSGTGPFRYFAFSGNGAGVALSTPANVNTCTLATSHLYCQTYDDATSRLHRLPLTGAAGVSIIASVGDIAATSTGVVFTSYGDPDAPDANFSLWNWPTSSATATERITSSYGLTGDVASGSTAGTALVVRGGAVGTAGIYTVPVPTGTSSLLLAAPAQPRAGTSVAIGPGRVAWSDNARFDGSVWTRSLDASGAPSSAESLVASNATGATLSLSGDRLTYTQGRSRFGGTRLQDGATVTPINDSGIEAALSGDRLLYQSRVMTADDALRPWSLRNLRTGTVTALDDARWYDVWGERLVRLDDDGSVWLSDLRTGAAPVQLRAATPAPYVYGSVHIAGDTVVWDVTTGDGGMPGIYTRDTRMRDVERMAEAEALTGLETVSDVSTGYAFGQACPESDEPGPGCHAAAVSLTTGEATAFESGVTGAVDGNLAAVVDPDGIPSVVALPAYADAPRLLAAPGAPTTLTSGASWTVRVVASRLLSSCAVEIRNSADTLVRSLPCTDPNAATTVTWDGRDTAGAAVPTGSYSWRIAASAGGADLVDYDGSVTALSGTVTVSAPTGPTVTAQTPAANGTSASVATNVLATFSKAVQGVSGTTFRLRNAAGTVISAAVSYNATSRTATLNPGANLAADTRYTATLTGGATAIRDGANAPLPTTSWTFTTGPAPTASTVSPAVDGTSFAVAGNPYATFSEPVTGVGAATFTIAPAAGGSTLPATVSYSTTTRRATLNPNANLTPDTRYTLTLTGGTSGIRDAAGNPLVTRSWSFTTGPAPTVTTRMPASGATGVIPSTNVTAVFSEGVQGVSGTTFRLRNPAGTVVSAVVSYNATTRTATLNPNANLAAGTRYTVGLAGGATAIRDAAGNPLQTVTWAFTTR